MKYARKKPKTVMAYQLGSHSPMEKDLICEGAIRLLPDGSYALFSQEAVNGKGEIALPGDYFKVDIVDGMRYPYPNSRKYFEANHRHLQGDTYEQSGSLFAIWQDGDDPCEEMDFLISGGRLVICKEDSVRYFNAILWDAPLSAARDATVVFYQVERGSQGRIRDVRFNFVARRDFERDYDILDGM